MVPGCLSPFEKGGLRRNAVHLSDSKELVGSAHPNKLFFVILSGAKRSEESLCFPTNEVRDSSVAFGSLRMTREMTSPHFQVLK